MVYMLIDGLRRNDQNSLWADRPKEPQDSGGPVLHTHGGTASVAGCLSITCTPRPQFCSLAFCSPFWKLETLETL